VLQKHFILALLKFNTMTKSTTLKRNYRCKDVEVLTVCSDIVSTAQSNLATIVAKRTNWANPFFLDLKTRIDTAFQIFLGVDNAADLRAKTKVVNDALVPAKNDLSTFKINIMADFKNNKPRLNEILTTLGFNQFWKQVQGSNNQEALIELLYNFKTNMTPALQTEITTAGTDANLIIIITGYADTLKDANIDQEFAKSQRPLISAAAVTEFNGIYDEISKVCTICRNMFKDDAVLKNNFSFAAVKRRLSGETIPKKKETQKQAA